MLLWNSRKRKKKACMRIIYDSEHMQSLNIIMLLEFLYMPSR